MQDARSPASAEPEVGHRGVAAPWRPLTGVPAELPAILASSTLWPNVRSQVLIVQPLEELQNCLVRTGCLEEIARYCKVRIDLGAEVHPASRQMILNGTILSVSAA